MMPNSITNLKCRRLGFVMAVVLLAIGFAVAGPPATTAFAQTCMEDVVEDLDGTNAVPLNCTAEDVRIGQYNLLSGPTECVEGDPVTVELQAELVAGSAERWDIGLFVALDGGDALRGECLQEYLPPPLSTTSVTPPGPRSSPFFNGEDTEDPGDTCGDLEQGVVNLRDLPEITVICRDEDADGFLDVGTCVSWDNQRSAGSANKPSCTDQLDTRPNTKAKCKCEPVFVPITVRKFAYIEVIKDIEPNWAEGLFNLEIDGEIEYEDASDDDTTGKVKVSAGTLADPGDEHTVGETAGTGTDLAAYTSSIECVDRGTDPPTFNEGDPLTFNGPGPLTVPVDPDDDIVCTITNTRGPGNITVEKTGDNLTKVGDEVDYRVDITNDGAGQFSVFLSEISDSLAGNLKSGFIDNTCDDTAYILGYNESCYITYKHTVAAGDIIANPAQPPPDKVVKNTVTVVAYDPNEPTPIEVTFTDIDDKYVPVFEPAIEFSKTGSPTLMVEGTQVNYEIKLTGGNSTPNTPNMTCTITDEALGINQQVSLAWNGVVTLTPSKTWDFDGVDESYCTGGPDSYDCTNTAKVSCDIEDFEGLNELDAEASKTVTVIPADLALSITKDCSEYSKVDTWEGWTEADKIDYQIVITNETSNLPLTIVSVDDTVLGTLTDCNGTLAAGASCTITRLYAVPGADDGDSITNEVSVTFNDGAGGSDITFPGPNDTPVTCTTTLVHPALTVAKSCASPDPVPAGRKAIFNIKVSNTGDVPLKVNVVDNDFEPPLNLDVDLNTAPVGGCSDDDDYGNGGTPQEDANDGCLLLTGSITATGETVSNTVTATATLPDLYALSNVLNRESSDTCDVGQDVATRTWGFWKTHKDYACHVLEEHILTEEPFMDLGWKEVTSCPELYAIFWAHRSFEFDGDKRSKGCATQIRCSGQVAAAQLNDALTNGAPLDPDDLATVLDALKSGNFKAINKACAPIAGYNESFDDVSIIDEHDYSILPADPNGARDDADFPFADCNDGNG